jgi:hypothetical protein
MLILFTNLGKIARHGRDTVQYPCDFPTRQPDCANRPIEARDA